MNRIGTSLRPLDPGRSSFRVVEPGSGYPAGELWSLIKELVDRL